MKNDLLPFAKDLRKNATDAERLLWKLLRSKRFEGLKFRRQQQIGRYIVDFVCLDQKMIIEIDGGQHTEQARRDTMRDTWLRNEGFTVYRFWNHEVLRNIEGVLTKLLSHPPQTPPLKGGDII